MSCSPLASHPTGSGLTPEKGPDTPEFLTGRTSQRQSYMSTASQSPTTSPAPGGGSILPTSSLDTYNALPPLHQIDEAPPTRNSTGIPPRSRFGIKVLSSRFRQGGSWKQSQNAKPTVSPSSSLRNRNTSTSAALKSYDDVGTSRGRGSSGFTGNDAPPRSSLLFGLKTSNSLGLRNSQTPVDVNRTASITGRLNSILRGLPKSMSINSDAPEGQGSLYATEEDRVRRGR